MLDLIQTVRKKKRMRFEQAFSEAPTRETVVTYFLALLELLRLGQMHIRQDSVYGEIELIYGKYRQKEEADLTSLSGSSTWAEMQRKK